jgi:hypothetical protein
MPCDRILQKDETLTMRKESIRKKTEELERGLASGKIKVRIGPQGAVAFEDWADRGQISDNCAYRRIMAKGSAMARMKVADAEQLAGRSVSKKMVAQGAHSHDGGASWHSHK